jgi:N-methylhydantoinase A
VSLPDGVVDDAYIDAIRDRFESRYQELYGQSHPEVAIEFITCRVTSTGPDRNVGLPQVDADEKDVVDDRARKGTRPVHFGGDFVETAVIDRYALRAGDAFDGPAVVEERESTVVVPPDMTAGVDAYGNLIVRTREGSAR